MDERNKACKCCNDDFTSHKLYESLIFFEKIIKTDHPKANITLLSVCRCKQHNRKIGGAENSYHCVGYAADLTVRGLTLSQMVSYAKKVPLFESGGIGAYAGWWRPRIHVDIRHYKARWGKIKDVGKVPIDEAIEYKSKKEKCNGTTKSEEAKLAGEATEDGISNCSYSVDSIFDNGVHGQGNSRPVSRLRKVGCRLVRWIKGSS